MATLRDEYSGKNDPYKKLRAATDALNAAKVPDYGRIVGIPIPDEVMTGVEWYEKFRLLAMESGYYSDDLPMMKLARRAANLTDKETTDE